MKSALCLAVYLLCAATYVCCSDYMFGNKTSDTSLVYKEKVVYAALPWKKRVKYFSYVDVAKQPIKAIICNDYQRTEATVNVTAGGIDYTFVTLRMKSQRSYGLEYSIEIYV